MKKILLFALFIFLVKFSPQSVFAQTSPYKGIKSVSYTFPAEFSETSKTFAHDLPTIKSLGFNTVWLVMPWWEFESTALPSPVYNEDNFSKLKDMLLLLKQNNMRAILPLDYVWGGSLHPVGIDPDGWVKDPAQYGAFELYVKELLTRISDYHDVVYILLFVEGTEVEINPYDANQHAALLRTTLGSLPKRLPPDLRSNFRIGFHYGVSFIFNIDYVTQYNPIEDPISYDFISAANYDTFLGISPDQIRGRADQEVKQSRTFYTNTPIIFGEFGATSCSTWLGNEDTQTQTDTTLIHYFLDNGYGFSLWGWKSLVPEWTCVGTNNAEGGLGIYNYDGSPKKVVNALKAILNPPAISGDLNGDGKIDIYDYNQLITDFGKTGNPGFIPADINKDGIVNIYDYNILVGNFGRHI